MSFLRLKLRDHVRQKSNTEKTNETENHPLSPKEQMKVYRKRPKESPALYKAYKENEAARGRQYRASLNDAQKADQREKPGCESSNGESNKSSKVQKKTQQEKWRLRKQQQRVNMTAQKKRRLNEKRRAKCDEKKQRTKTNKEKHSNKESSRQEIDGYKTDDEQNRPYHGNRKKLHNASPRKRKALEQEGFSTPAVKKRHIDFVKQYQKEMQDTYHLERRRHIASIAKINTHERTEFGFSWGFAYKASQLDGF
ncbi:hypothetical protein MAR_023717 [Mya arenaria]|uniref:Uncharacterized protein n=1 Tax=Mya arenaria TaxID=6604 RepID=A0ABY7DNS2_MYAAR|nr:hypothetical protein MAR_023717 [Mya arenaria]